MSCSKFPTMSSSEAIANNDDLLTEILVRLPIKSLLKSKCISKHWHSLISGPCFARRLHPDTHLVSGLILHRPCLGLINAEFYDFVPLKNKLTSDPFRSLTFVNQPLGLRILQSCNGLLLCSSFRNEWNLSPNCVYYVYNPTSRQFVTLPPLRTESPRTFHRIGLAYDPVKSPHYEIVCIRSLWEGISNARLLSYQIEIYSSQTGSWRRSGPPFVLPYYLYYEVGVFWNGAVYWIDSEHACLYFNFDEEQLQEMPMPPSLTYLDNQIGERRRLRYFGESREHLHLVELCVPCTMKIDVYEMERDYSCWFVKYHIDLNAVMSAFPEMIIGDFEVSDIQYYAFSILGVIREANDSESYMVLHIPGKAICYNLNDKTFCKICDFDPGCEDTGSTHSEGLFKFWWFHAFQYIETLACV